MPAWNGQPPHAQPMTDIVKLTASEVAPERASILELQGIPAGRSIPAGIEALCDKAVWLFAELGEPIGMFKEINKQDFAAVYQGRGKNEPRTPVGDIFEQADRLALFAVTLGPRVSREISHRFESNDFALGCMLDSVASAAADKLAEVIERHYCDLLANRGELGPGDRALRYSPGYCGWHVSGQGALFRYLEPETIGISLRESFLMDPLKSVSGVVLAGPRQMHDFDNTYPFCVGCETQGCRERAADSSPRGPTSTARLREPSP